MDANTQTGQESPSTPVSHEIPSEPAKRDEWLSKGAPFKADAKPATDGNAKTVEDKSSSDKTEKSASASETDKKEQESNKPKSKAQERLEEILEDLKKAGLTPSELKAYKREQAIQAKETTELNAKPPERPKRPKLSDFYEKDDPQAEYDTALDKYESESREFDRRETIAEFMRAQQHRETVMSLNQEVAKSKELYGEEAGEIVEATAKELVGNNEFRKFLEPFLAGFAHQTDLLYVLGSKPDDFKSLIQLSKSDPESAIRQVLKLKDDIKAIRSKKPAVEKTEVPDAELPDRGEDGKFVSRKISKAPPPPEELGGSKGSPPDEVQAALKTGDVRAYIEAQNTRDAARFIRK